MAKMLITILGVVFIVVGLLGFFNNPILGIFEVDAMHNVVHLLTGVLALVFASKGNGSAKMFAKTFGIIYLLIAVLGFITVPDGGKVLNVIETNMADHILHVVLATIFLVIGFSKDRGE